MRVQTILQRILLVFNIKREHITRRVVLATPETALEGAECVRGRVLEWVDRTEGEIEEKNID